MRAAADAAPGPLSALAAGIATFAARALYARRLIWAVTGEPVEPELDALRRDFRQSLAAELAARISAAAAARHLPELDANYRRAGHRRRAAGRADRAAGAVSQAMPPPRAKRCRPRRCWRCARSA